MRFFVFALLLAVAFSAPKMMTPNGVRLGRRDARVEFENFKLRYNKAYSLEEEAVRFTNFKSNLEFIRNHDAKNAGFTVAMNKFGDLSREEYLALLRPQTYNLHPGKEVAVDATMTVDWRDKGAVVPIKDQGQCGSCWAFSTVVGLEGCHFLATNKLVSLSESMLVDCDSSDDGCNGGLMQNAYGWIEDNGGLCTEADYPYKPTDGSCKKSKCTIAAGNKGHTMVDQTESALQDAVTNVGPIPIAIDASNMSFQFYSSGVYDESSCSSTELDHGVTAVGYGTDSGKNFWIVRNSWGEGWGLDGYIWMVKDKNNQCGEATNAVYPTGCF